MAIMQVNDRFGILGIPANKKQGSLGQAGWSKGDEEWSQENPARPYEYESEENLARTYAAYMDVWKAGDKAKTERAFAEYRDAYDAYGEETPVRQKLEKLADDMRADSAGDLPGSAEDYRRRQQERLDAMEKLWLGWYRAHLDWEVYRYTGGDPDWWRSLKAGAASALDIALQVLPFLPYAKGAAVATRGALQRFPKLPVATPSTPRAPVTTPGGRSVTQPMRYPVVNESGKKTSPAYAPTATPGPAMSPGKPPSQAAAPPPPVTTPSGGPGAGTAGGGWNPEGGMPGEWETAPWLRKYSPEVRGAFWKWINNRGIKTRAFFDPEMEETFGPIVEKFAMAKEFVIPPFKETPPSQWEIGLDSRVVLAFKWWATKHGISDQELSHPGSQDFWRTMAIDEGRAAGILPKIPTVQMPTPPPAQTQSGFYPTGGAPEPRPSMVYPIPKTWNPEGGWGPSAPENPEGKLDPWGRFIFPPVKSEEGSIYKWRPTPQSKAPSEPAPVATQGAGSNQCPPDAYGRLQFWDGTKCRGSVDVMPGIPTDQATATAQAAAFPGITMGRRFRVVNL